jgi:cytochrome c peroxidase
MTRIPPGTRGNKNIVRQAVGQARSHMHNGYFKSLKEVVHFYNTRDVLPRCKSKDPGEKVTCWP